MERVGDILSAFPQCGHWKQDNVKKTEETETAKVLWFYSVTRQVNTTVMPRAIDRRGSSTTGDRHVRERRSRIEFLISVASASPPTYE